jgi:hypothetical protein
MKFLLLLQRTPRLFACLARPALPVGIATVAILTPMDELIVILSRTVVEQSTS